MRKGWIIALMACSACGSSEDPVVENALRSGASHYRADRFMEADSAFAKASNDERAVFNQAAANFRLGNWIEAIARYGQAAAMATDTAEQAKAYHGLGTTHLAEAIAADTLFVRHREQLAAIKIEGNDIAQKVNLFVLRDSLVRENRRLENLIDSSLIGAVAGLKNCLRRTPSDEDARYNLALSQHIVGKRVKEGRGKGDGKDDKDKDKELTERAKLFLKRADELVEVYKFQEALDVLQQGLQQDPSLKAKKEYMDKLDLVTKAAQAS